MARRIEALALSALLAGCHAETPKAKLATAKLNAGQANALSFVKGVAWARRYCPQFAGDISDHPEADARADFARGERRGVGYVSWDLVTPGGTYSQHCPIGAPGMRRIKGMDGDVATCLSFIGDLYAERYNRELMRLCATH